MSVAWRRALAALDLPPADHHAVRRELEVRLLTLPSLPHGSLELDDVWAIAVEAAWWARQRAQPVGRRVRFAVLELFRREGRAHGHERRRAPGEQATSRDPARWRRCPCGHTVASRQATYCPPCMKARRLEWWRGSRRRRRPPHPCACGCGGLTMGTWVPGHNMLAAVAAAVA